MGRSSPDNGWRHSNNERARAAACLVLALGLAPAPDLAAHRLDEYLQATRITLSPDRIRVEIDLTPGVEVASSVRQSIDTDRNGEISDAEAGRYATEVLDQLVLRQDDAPQGLRLERYQFPSGSDLDEGTGTIRLEASAEAAASQGLHRLSFLNSHRTDVGAYLVNILMPSNEIAIADQRRDPLQRGIDVDFSIAAARSRSLVPFLLTMLALTAFALVVHLKAPSSSSENFGAS